MRAAPRVMIFAHMDELGMVVRRIEDDGFLRMERVGGLPERVLAGQAVEVLATDGARVEGMVGTKAHHYTEADEKYRVLPIKSVYVDVGAASAAEARGWGIAVGSPVVYWRAFMRRGTRVFSPALDDRAGCLVLLELARRLAGGAVGAEVYLVASVQEEFNLRGVLPAGRSIAPDLALSVDVCVATDTPDLRDQVDVRLGRGPALGTYSFHGRGTLGGVIPNPRLLALLEQTAARAELAVQRNVFFGGLTDASFLQMEGEGIPCLDVGIPTRYTHSPLECCDLRDVEATITLLERFLRELPQPLDLTRG